MANVDQKQEKIEDKKKIIMRKKKKKLGGIKTMPFIFGMFANSCSSRTTVFSYRCFLSGIDNVYFQGILTAREIQIELLGSSFQIKTPFYSYV